VKPEVLTTELEDGAVLLDMDRGIYYSLNPAGLEIWRRLESASPVQNLATELTRRFDVDQETAQSSVARFTDELEHEGLVVRSDAPAGTSASGESGADGVSEQRRRFEAPALTKHEEPLYEVTSSPFDPQLPLAE
jgi:hypothetical protein